MYATGEEGERRHRKRLVRERDVLSLTTAQEATHPRLPFSLTGVCHHLVCPRGKQKVHIDRPLALSLARAGVAI